MANTKPEDWREKYLEQSKTLKVLSGHCMKVVEKHEELVQRFNTNKIQYDSVVNRLHEREQQLLHIRKLLEPVYSEYASLKEKYEIEQECRQEAEKYASQITQENRVLKRQSKVILDDVSEDIQNEKEEDLYQEYLKKLNTKITELEEEKTSLSANYNKLNEDYKILKENYSDAKLQNDNLKDELQQSRASINKYKDALKNVTSVSEAAYEEYERLKKEYEVATVCQNKAESFASEMYAQSEAMKRQSAVLLSSAMSDQRLMEALQEVENLTQELETIKKEKEHRIVELEKEISELKDEDLINSLETDNQTLHEERDALFDQLNILRTQYSQFEKDHKSLESQYAELEKKYEDIVRPPPPPPPPLPPVSVLRPKGFLSRTQSKRTKERHQKLEKGGAQPNAQYSEAITEMLSRIKSGTQPLKHVLKPINRRPSCPDENSGAIEELHSVLNKMKRNKSLGDILDIEGIEDLPESELKTAFQKVKKITK